MKKLPITNTIFHLFFTATLALLCGHTIAEENAPKAMVALVGDTDQFNIGQGNYCDDRSEISSPSGKQFRIPSSKKTFFFIRSKFYTPTVSHICEGDFSFIAKEIFNSIGPDVPDVCGAAGDLRIKK